MPAGGRRAGAGRPKGTVMLKTHEFIEKALAGGPSPLDVMLMAMRYHLKEHQEHLARLPTLPTEQEQRACQREASAALSTSAGHARDAAPYIHPRLQTTELKGDGGSPIKHFLEIEFVSVSEKGEGSVSGGV